MKSQNKRLLTALKAGQVIDPMYALSQLGIFRLAARIYDLNETGVTIKREWRKVFNRFGEETKVRVYWI